MAVRTLVAFLLLTAAFGQAEKPPSADVEFVCPMDPDVRTKGPAKCPRCGMKLIPGLPRFEEFRMEVSTEPSIPKPGQDVDLTFRVLDSKSNPVSSFEVVHEKLFHLFIVSQDLESFAHEHPELRPDGTFRYRYRFPKSGMYRVLGDFYPKGATPQLVPATILLPGDVRSADLQQDLTPKQGPNLKVSLRLRPEKPIAGLETLMFFDLDSADKLEPYLGAWGHMLAASSDMIDMVHVHPQFEDPAKTIQFNVIFPRPGVYRVWVQFQRDGMVNTVAFNVPVEQLK